MPERQLRTIPLSDDQFLQGDVILTDRPSAFCILWVHGFGSHRGGEKSAALAAACANHGWNFAAFDFRGHGTSSGTLRDLRASRLQQDLTAIQNDLATLGLTRLGLVGSSMGGFASAWFAQHTAEVEACVLLAPAFRFLQRRIETLSAEELRQWKEAGVRQFRNDWVNGELSYGLVEEVGQFPTELLARNWKKPLLIFHGSRDEVIPLRDTLDFLEMVQGTQIDLRVYPAGDHRLTDFKDEIAAEVCRFMGAVVR